MRRTAHLACIAALSWAGMTAAAPAATPTPAHAPARPDAGEVLCHDRPDCRLTLVARLRYAPFPYDGPVGDGKQPFFDRRDPVTKERLHSVGEELAYPERPHYRDNRVLIHVPPRFDPKRRFHLVVFFHGHDSEILRTVADELAVIRQVNASGRNVILVAPQLARDARDSSPGKLGRPGGLGRLMNEVADVLAARLGRRHRAAFGAAPVALVGFSGGYKTVAYGLDRGGIESRITAVFLLDAVYAEVDRFVQWLQRQRRRAALVVIHGSSSRPVTEELERRLKAAGLGVTDRLPPTLGPGIRAVIAVDTDHGRIPLDGPPHDPVAELLRRLPR